MGAAAEVIEVAARFPEKLGALWRPSRFKVIYGGRGSGKSWGVARALLALGMEKPLRILCTRETQKSLRESVHTLLRDQVRLLGLERFYEVNKETIRGVNGTQFVFTGLADHTVDTLKSYEGVDIAWIEEGQSVSEYSWQILLPTIRKDDSEIWVTFNPELDTDATWQMFIAQTPPSTVLIEMNWRDNPWFNQVMNDERLHARRTMNETDYLWIWEGRCKPAIQGAIYASELAELQKDGRCGDYPPDAFEPLHAIFDLGWNDSTAIIIAQKKLSKLLVVDYLEGDHQTLDWYSTQLRAKPYQIQDIYLPHDGAAADIRGPSPERILQGLRWNVHVLERADVEHGIRETKMAFRSVFINAKPCARLIECLKRYRRNIPRGTGEPANPLHDEYSHGADAFRYMVQAAPQMGAYAAQGGLRLPPLKYGWKP